MLKTWSVILFIFTAHCLATDSCSKSQITILESEIDSAVAGEDETAIVWLAAPNPNERTVLVPTVNGVLWRSKDSGRHWENVTLPNNAFVQSIYLSSDSTGVILGGTQGHLWNSPDGQTFHHVDAPGELHDLKFHPLHSDWVIGIVCDNFYYMGCPGKLYLSQDLGSHWALLRTGVRVADWHGLSDDEKMIVSWEGTTLLKSNTFFRSDPSVLATEVTGYKSVGKKIFMATGYTKLVLSVSEDFGETFDAVRFPLNLEEHRYTLLDTSEGFTFVNVQYDPAKSWGMLYSSNAFDTDFSLSLEQNVRAITGKCDFKAVAGIEGIYMANRFAKENEAGKQTLITFDKGSKWQRLSTPEGVTCVPKGQYDCSLNLLGTSDSSTWFSKKEAVGLVMGTGSVSQYLNNHDEAVGLYISRDAGLTWKFVSNGRYTYEIGNRGALLIALINDRTTSTLKYSLDEGDNWSDCLFVEELKGVEVKDIVSDPDMKSGLFLIYGTRAGKGILISVDFTNVFTRTCKGHDNPLGVDSDYEIWEPTDGTPGKCLLGRDTEYVRRKLSAMCLNPITVSMDTVIIVRNCSCTEEDYDCDFCFKAVGDACVLETSEACAEFDPAQPPAVCNGVYYETKGYRRVPGDTCDATRGVDHLPIAKTCPNSPPSSNAANNTRSSPGFLVAFLVIVALAAGAGGVWWVSGHNETVRSTLMMVIPERYLPDTRIMPDYNSVPTTFGDDLDDDAPEITLEEGSTNT
eukprot:TRINITY_DN2561_c0_g1_i1.p1 TRINITY_DN2561_c0_g1~~TRINITY_DN2561_c0_g1_i1.p1  ORF type:complete len:742 (-),score=113.95 TRINITY_DN2561_c0_g1_i1:22-2247(-)